VLFRVLINRHDEDRTHAPLAEPGDGVAGVQCLDGAGEVMAIDGERLVPE
jgi:hypothetical protein